MSGIRDAQVIAKTFATWSQNRVSPWYPLTLPFGIGVACIAGGISAVNDAGDSSIKLEGALLGMAILGIAGSAIAFFGSFAIAMVIGARRRSSLREYIGVTSLATLPAMWLQSVNIQSSLMSPFWVWARPNERFGSPESMWLNAAAYALMFLVAAITSFLTARALRAKLG